jgi:plastocyanin
MQKSGMVLSRRRVVTAALLAVPLAGLSRFALNQDVQAADVAVTIMNFKFDPTPLTIPVGTTVVWTNQDTAPHTATSDPGSAFTFDTGMLQKGQSGKITFNQPGTFTYFCSVHPNMHGTVTVTQASGSTTTTTTAPSASAIPAATAAPTAAPATAVPTAAPSVAAPAAPPSPAGLPANFIRRLGDG